MIDLVPTIALALLSFFASTFVILRILIPILPPHPLSRRVSPSEFGLPTFRTLSPADKSHLWIVCCDLIALTVFVWHVFAQAGGAPASSSSDFIVANEPLAAARFWLSVNLRQTCLMVVSCITLLHVRVGRPVSFGSNHWLLWAPTALLITASTVFAGLFAGLHIDSFFLGLVAYSSFVAIVSTAALSSLAVTLVIIRKNLSLLAEPCRSWGPYPEAEKPRPSFATEDIDALKDGSSWLTSNSSHRQSISSFSFTTNQTSTKPTQLDRERAAPTGPRTLSGKSSFWFRSQTSYVPPVPRVPSIYRPASPTAASIVDDEDPFRRDDSHVHTVHEQRARMGSQSSWLTSPSVSQVTMSAWSYPTSRPGSAFPDDGLREGDSELLFPGPSASRGATPLPLTRSVEVLGGYGWNTQIEKGTHQHLDLTSGDLDVSLLRTLGWLTTIWIPFGFSLPYLFQVSFGSATPQVFGILLVLSMTLSSPLLALNIMFRSPLPIPNNLFESISEPPSVIMRAPSPVSTLMRVHDYKRSGSLTLVDEGRRSGDVWIKKGDATEGRSKFERAVGLLQPVPQLAVMPAAEVDCEEPMTPPLPLQESDMSPLRQAVPLAESTRHSLSIDRHDYKRADTQVDSISTASRIMVAQRHYSTLATTLIIPPSHVPSEKLAGKRIVSASMHSADLQSAIAASTSVSAPSSRRASQHLRSRSVSSVTIQGGQTERPRPPPTPPPTEPLPPTPTRGQLHWKEVEHGFNKSASSGFSFQPVADGKNTREIDALSAKLLPLLVPGLKVGPDTIVKDDVRPPTNKLLGRKHAATTHGRIGEGHKSPSYDPWQFGSISSFETPDIHSTPARGGRRKTPVRHGHHYSLPSLDLNNKDDGNSLQNWKVDLNRALSVKSNEIAEDDMDLNARIDADPLASSGTTTQRPNAKSGGAQIITRRTGRLQSPTVQDVPSSARSSLTTLLATLDAEINDPLRAAKGAIPGSLTALLEHDSGPLAESTHKDFVISESDETPTTDHEARSLRRSKRSSIVYIHSGDGPVSSARYAFTTQSPVGPNFQSALPVTKKLTKDRGLKPLSLLRARDLNRAEPRAADSPKTVRPLALNKNRKSNENSIMRELKPLKLVRSATARARGMLRQDEVLPDVVVRPPSSSQHRGFIYSFDP